MDRKPQKLHTLGLTKRIHNWSRIHPELDQESKQNLEIAVFRRERRNDSAETKGKSRDHQDEEREKEGIPVQMGRASRIHKVIDDVDNDKKTELNTEPQEVTDNMGHRHHQTREIHFPENVGVLHKGVRRLRNTIGEVLPQAGTCQVEQRPRDAVGRDAGDATENDHIHNDREGGLDHVPDGTQDGLLVLGDDIALDEQGTQVPVGP